MKVTLLRLETAWLALCAFGWLAISLSAESQAECYARGGFLCFSREETLYIVGLLLALPALVIGALLIALAWALVKAVRRIWFPRHG